MGDAPRCAARSKRSGRPCGKLCLKHPNGGFTRHCRFHGGVQERLAPGDPKRGGRPPISFSYVTTVPDEFRPFYDSARGELGNLEHEIALASTNLFRFQQRHEEQQKGGIPTSVSSGGSSVTVRPYADVVGEYLDRIRRLKESRARIVAIFQDLDEPPSPPAGALPATDGGPDENDPDISAEVRRRLHDQLLRDE